MRRSLTAYFKISFILCIFAVAITGIAQPTLQTSQDTLATIPHSNGTNASPSIDIIDIDAQSYFTVESPEVGDTLSYLITVEWVNPKVPVFVLAPESLSFSGFKKLRVSTKNKKIHQSESGVSTLKNRAEFIYKLQALTIGTGKASSTRLSYYTALSKEKEYLSIAPSLVDIKKARLPFTKTWIFKGIFCVFLLGLGAWGLIIFLNRKKPLKAKKEDSVLEQMKAIKSRLEIGESRNVILEMEKIAIYYLQEATANKLVNKLDPLLEEYLQNKSASEKEEWKSVSEEFVYAKFGGGKKQAYELKEIYQRLSQCFKLKKDVSDD